MQSAMHKVVIVGGGAGGLELATKLGRRLGIKRIARPVLVDASSTHVWKPLLHEVATGALNTGEDELNYFSHGHRNGYEFDLGRMCGLDRIRKCIKLAPIITDSGEIIIREREIYYDTLVLAVGSVTNDFGTAGVAANCHFLNNPWDAEKLRKEILIQAFRVITGNIEGTKLRIGIVGGGATGVELAAEIHHTVCELRNYGANLFADQLQITIMEGGKRILAAGPESLSKYATSELNRRNIEVQTNSQIVEVKKEGFVLADKTIVPAEIKIWTAGIKAHDWLGTIGLNVNNLNQIQLNSNLQTEEDANIMGLGDCTRCPDITNPGKYLTATAQVAHQQADWLAQKIEGRLTNKIVPEFKFIPQGVLVSLGDTTAVGSLAALVGPKRDYYVQGKGAKLLYASLYRMHQAVLYGWTRAALLWIGDHLRRVAHPQLKLH